MVEVGQLGSIQAEDPSPSVLPGRDHTLFGGVEPRGADSAFGPAEDRQPRSPAAPQNCGPVCTHNDNASAIRAQNRGADVLTGTERCDEAAVWIPQSGRSVVGGSDHASPIGAEHSCIQRVAWCRENRDGFAVGFPDPSRAVFARGENAGAVVIELSRPDDVVVARQHVHILVTVGAVDTRRPYAGDSIPTSRDDQRPVGAELRGIHVLVPGQSGELLALEVPHPGGLV